MLRKLKCTCVALMMLSPVAGSAHAETFSRIEVWPVQTATLSKQQILQGDRDGKPALIAGELQIPLAAGELRAGAGSDKVPAVILLNGSGGVNASVAMWVKDLNSIGIATFILDSFAGRGISRTAHAKEEAQLDSLAMIVDAYRALGILSKHPSIDPSRIAVMGFSKGAVPAVYSSNRRFQQLYAPAGTQFAAHIGFYTPCHTTYHGDDQTTGKPIRLFHGQADDYIAVGPCKEYVSRLRQAGADAALTAYPNALHEFDSAFFPKTVRIPEADTQRNCRWKEVDNGIIVNAKTGRPYGIDDPCVLLGPTMGYNKAASEAAEKDVKEFLITTFKLR